MADNKSLTAQNEVRENAKRLQEQMLGIKNFEKEMKQKENDESMKNVLQDEIPPIRSDISSFQKYLGATTNELDKKKQLANEFKEKGNSFVKSKDYKLAIDMYSQAIEIYPEEAVYYSNRSQCYLNLEQYNECIEDTNCAIKLDKFSHKSYYRRMTAYEKLQENMKALQNCLEWMSALPDDQIAKTSYDRIHNKLLESVKMKEKEKVKWTKSLESTRFIDKPINVQSKKHLKKINVSIKKSHSPIPDAVIDTIFNNNTGEHTPSSESNSILFRPNFLEASYTSSHNAEIKNDKAIINETNELLKANGHQTLVQLNESFNQNDLIVLPLTGVQFCAAWKELSDEQKFIYLKNIAENKLKIGQLIGAQLTADLLAGIIRIIHHYFISYNISYINLIYELSKNSELSILSMFLEQEDKEKLNGLLKNLKTDNDVSNMIQQIKQNFQISSS